ncbi:hypothetical protein J7T55_009044 [Diaporthe amygdali]|uniref:uncharacterized protein n=1 Tax=Phomopsis amygdali TaxID=1214568 RepID=UPI0022FE3F17|nr:uncharacterized protein J7T55_009044 [Diaporthe amygdali]KAJ0118261.1 hypothetical protein J7T55_009044 [Diaporthe amygdali]
MSSQVGTIYRHDENYVPISRWSEFVSLKDEADELEVRMATKDIVHRLAGCEGSWTTLSFTINNVLMRDLLTRVFEGYQGFDLNLANWTFQDPFRPLVHRWGQLNALHSKLIDDEDVTVDEKEAGDALVSFLGPILAPSVGALAQTRDTGRISYKDVWQIFPPSELVVTTLWGIPLLGRVLKYKNKNSRGWRITFEKLAWDGSCCGYVQEVAWVEPFSGERYVNALDVYPLSFHTDPEGFKSKMLERGRKFERLRGYHSQTYKGNMHMLENDFMTGKRSVEGRVIVDTFAYYASSNLGKPNMRPLECLDEETAPMRSRSRTTSRASSRSSTRSHSEDSNRSPSPSQPSESGDFVQVSSDLSDTSDHDLWGRNEDLSPLTSEQCLISDPWLRGFDLKAKRWGLMNIDGLSDIEWNYDAFDNLVVPADEKQLAWDFVESKTTSNEAFDDFIPEKGRGIIILMFGPPGVGKTFTAEAVAERANVPLYSMSASSLGTEPAEIEQNLDSALQLCKVWNAMLLLDEADVFLAARQSDNMKRNELVSLFLTKLEYYPGILFLTTNRASDIDFAFQSRVDLFLPYYELTPEARLKIWNNFIDRAGREGFASANMEGDLEKLSRLSLNGREIKNLVKTSQLLSQKTGGLGSMEKLYFLAEKRVHALKLLAERGT